MQKPPKVINYHTRSRMLELIFADGTSCELDSEYLRVYSPSAEVQGHSPEQAVLQQGKKDVRITHIEHQGNYAIKLVFDDGHDSGIYSWTYLRELADNRDGFWADYLRRLQDAGGTRDSGIIASSRANQWNP